MSEIINSNLAHYGVPGMKWGVRKAPPPRKGSSSSRKGQAKKFSSIAISTLREIGKAAVDSWREQGLLNYNVKYYPLETARARYESKENDSISVIMRKAMYETPDEIQDINRRVEAMRR